MIERCDAHSCTEAYQAVYDAMMDGHESNGWLRERLAGCVLDGRDHGAFYAAFQRSALRTPVAFFQLWADRMHAQTDTWAGMRDASRLERRSLGCGLDEPCGWVREGGRSV